jgi:hypothetical protein
LHSPPFLPSDQSRHYLIAHCRKPVAVGMRLFRRYRSALHAPKDGLAQNQSREAPKTGERGEALHRTLSRPRSAPRFNSGSSAGPSELKSLSCIRQARQTQSPHIALDHLMNNQQCPQSNLEDTKKAYQSLFDLQKEACALRDRDPDKGVSGHLARILACSMSLIRTSQRYAFDMNS